MGYGFKNELKVGAFVAAGLTILLGSILVLGGDQMFLKSKFELRARFNDVQGLDRGSVVSLAGIHVGNIQELIFNPENNAVDIVMDIDRDYQKQITTATKASVKTQGALGDKYIYLLPTQESGSPLQDGAYIEVDSTGDLFDILAKKGDELGDALAVVKELHLFMMEINRDGRSAALVKNAVEMTANLNQLAKESRLFIQELRGPSLTHLSSVLKKLDQGQGSLGAFINDPTLHQKLTSLVGETPRNKFLMPLLRDSIKKSEESK